MKYILVLSVFQIDHTIHVLSSSLNERQKKFSKSVEQFSRVTETLATLKKIKRSMDEVVPKMEMLNSMLPESEQLEPFVLNRERSVTKP